jgi:Uma2 family endonuclease
MSPAGHEHGRVAARLTSSLGLFVDEHDLGAVYAAETGFLLARNPDTVRAPDVAFVRADRLAAVSAEGFFPGPPDLAVEVVSPSDSYSAVEEKVFEWLDAGCRAVVVLDPRRQVATVYRSRQNISLLSPPDLLSAEDLVPGWSVPLAQLFR